MKLFICWGSFDLKENTNPSSLQRHQGKDIPIVTRTHRLAWSNLIRKLEVSQVKKKKNRNMMNFQKWNLAERGFAYKPMSQVLACLCSCTSPLFSPWMSGLHPQEEQLDPARDHCPAPPGLHAQGWKGTQWLLIPSSQQGPPTVSTWMILHFDNFIVITRAESKFNSPGV